MIRVKGRRSECSTAAEVGGARGSRHQGPPVVQVVEQGAALLGGDEARVGGQLGEQSRRALRFARHADPAVAGGVEDDELVGVRALGVPGAPARQRSILAQKDGSSSHSVGRPTGADAPGSRPLGQ